MSINPAVDTVVLNGSTSGAVTLRAAAIAGSHNATLPAADGILALVLGATTAAIGGGALAAGASASATVAVVGATAGMAVIVSPSANPQVDASHALSIWGYVSAADVVTVVVSAIVATTPNSVTYNVRVIK